MENKNFLWRSRFSLSVITNNEDPKSTMFSSFILVSAALVQKYEKTRQMSSMIHSATPTVSPVGNLLSLEICFVLISGRTDERTKDKQSHLIFL